MMKEVTFGKYYNTLSPVHSLDGRIKLVAFLAFVVSVWFVKTPLCFVVAVLITAAVILLSNIPFAYIFRSVWHVKYYILLFITLTLISDFSTAGLVKALLVVLRLVLAILWASLFTLTTTVSHVSDSFEWFLTPLKLVGVNVRDVAVMLSIALRFIPVLAEEAERVAMAQKARGAQIKKPKNLAPMLIPVFASAIKRSTDLADALKARFYGVYGDRTRLYPLKFGKNDLTAFLIICLYLALIIWGCIYAR